MQSIDYVQLANNIKAWAKSLGFQGIGIADIDVSQHEQALKNWLENDYHGSMSFFERNMDKRLSPDLLLPGTLRIISVRMNYLPKKPDFAKDLGDPNTAYISRYALGRDYHKVMRKRLKQLAEKIKFYCENLNYRPFVDSAPVLEHAVAEKAGIGWTGKHTLTIDDKDGSWFFLGELFVNIPLPVDSPIETKGCGSCTACISICPTDAIVAPYQIDAKRCISYLTIEHDGPIDEQFREAMGNRIYGCDDCQLVCPYNRYAPYTEEDDFTPRSALEGASLIELFSWTEAQFLKETEGSPIRRIGYKKWLRNLSVALGNAPYSEKIISLLLKRLDETDDATLTEHFAWALSRQKKKQSPSIQPNLLTRQQARLVRIIKKANNANA
uniref:tRNA epoxyqueuosine(34) reductase QueG n=1 Tax=Ningiella ruwaisensis TaxID=2364274 RepID=UPI00109F124F|nr:tRNA epoxyqueuosine(34) reductase QueG [Ningiella ruwaisensis]